MAKINNENTTITLKRNCAVHCADSSGMPERPCTLTGSAESILLVLLPIAVYTRISVHSFVAKALHNIAPLLFAILCMRLSASYAFNGIHTIAVSNVQHCTIYAVV